MAKRNPKSAQLITPLLGWFAAHARDLPWRRTRDPYAIWVSEIMLQQTQVKTVIPFWERWLRELPTIESLAAAPPAKIHKLWEGLGYYTRVRNLQKAAQQIVAQQSVCRKRVDESLTKKKFEIPHVVSYKFPDNFDAVLDLPGVGRYTAGAICSIAFNQPTPILDGNVIRVLTRIFGITENPKERKTNTHLWQLAEELVSHAKTPRTPRLKTFASFASMRGENSCSFLNQSLMELGALICAPRQPQCNICPVKKLCIARRDDLVDQLPNLGKRAAATARHFVAFVVERHGKFLVRQRPAGVVNAHLWEFPNEEIAIPAASSQFRVAAKSKPLCAVKHSITRYRITLDAYRAKLPEEFSEGRFPRVPNLKTKDGTRITPPSESTGVWLTLAELEKLAFTGAHRKILAKLTA